MLVLLPSVIGIVGTAGVAACAAGHSGRRSVCCARASGQTKVCRAYKPGPSKAGPRMNVVKQVNHEIQSFLHIKYYYKLYLFNMLPKKCAFMGGLFFAKRTHYSPIPILAIFLRGIRFGFVFFAPCRATGYTTDITTRMLAEWVMCQAPNDKGCLERYKYPQAVLKVRAGQLSTRRCR